MIGRGLRVGSLLGVDIRIDASWLVEFEADAVIPQRADFAERMDP